METRLTKEIRLPKFDLTSSLPCQYFKSSFAKTLSNSSSQNLQAAKSLDFFNLHSGELTASNVDFASLDDADKFTAELQDSFQQQQQQQQRNQQVVETNVQNAEIRSAVQTHQKNIWNIKQDIKISSTTTTVSDSQHIRAMTENRKSILSSRKSYDTSEVEVLRLRKECQNLIEENRRLLSLTTNGHAMNGTSEHCSTVEAVILQNQVETLQWQLKQVESSRQMYRAVMEEVVRFLDRCHHSLDAIQLSALINGGGMNGAAVGHHGRSKSVLQVSKCNDSDSSGTSSPRARSSTNLIDVQKNLHHLKGSVGGGDSLIAPAPMSYTNFRDYTWRRSPKSSSTLPISMNEVEPEKLSKEAFRLLRTIQNLLNTQEPALAQNAMDNLMMLPTERAGSACSSSGLSAGLCEGNSDASSVSGNGGGSGIFGLRPIAPAYHNSPFNRKMNSRDSRLSLRSSTDDSVHSSSSSAKTETDDDSTTDRPSPTLSTQSSHQYHHHHQQHRNTVNGIERIKDMMLTNGGSNGSAEDESGFSSMNSFQDIGLPISHSTMLSSSSSVSASDESVADLETTLKASPPTVTPPPPPRLDRNGLPPSLPPHNHRRWESAPIVPPKFKLHTMSTNDDALRVLWV